MSKWRYFKLLDQENEGKVVKAQGRYQFEYHLANKEWVRSGILIDYLFADIYSTSPKKASDFEEITEAEALKLVSK